MIRHCLKLAWNRKRANALVIVEILVSFLVLFSVVLIAAHFYWNFQSALGFEYQNVWSIMIDTGSERVSQPDEQGPFKATFREIMRELQAFPGVEGVAGSATVPYFGGAAFYLADGSVGFEVTDDFGDVMGVSLTEGRWFRPDDDQLNWVPVVINERLAGERFPGESPLGKTLSVSGGQESRVVGVMREYRREGDLAPSESLGIWRMSLTGRKGSVDVTPYLLLRVGEGYPPALKEDLLERLRSLAPGWSFELKSLTELRKDYLRTSMIPLAVGSIILLFLLIMVALGLIGVLWQSIGRRTKEIGIRRANGATSASIYLQFIGEVTATTAIGIGLGGVIIFQLPVFELIGSFAWAPYTVSILISTTIMFLLAVACAAYPSWLGARMHPISALHHE